MKNMGMEICAKCGNEVHSSSVWYCARKGIWIIRCRSCYTRHGPPTPEEIEEAVRESERLAAGMG